MKSLLEALGKQRVHQMTEGSNVGGGGGADGVEGQEEGDAGKEEEAPLTIHPPMAKSILNIIMLIIIFNKKNLFSYYTCFYVYC